MSGRGSARLQCVAALCTIAPVAAFGQAVPTPPPAQPHGDPTELDPSAPLDPLPDLGVPWPDLNARDDVPPSQTQQPEPSAAPDTGEHKYVLEIDGLGAVGDSEDLLKAFRLQSALETHRKDAANAAQIARRSRA